MPHNKDENMYPAFPKKEWMNDPGLNLAKAGRFWKTGMHSDTKKNWKSLGSIFIYFFAAHHHSYCSINTRGNSVHACDLEVQSPRAVFQRFAPRKKNASAERFTIVTHQITSCYKTICHTQPYKNISVKVSAKLRFSMNARSPFKVSGGSNPTNLFNKFLNSLVNPGGKK